MPGGNGEDRLETFEEKLARVLKETVDIAPYDPRWPEMFEKERRHLLTCLPAGIIRRIEHFGSTAVPGLPAKPIIDMLIEVSSLDETKAHIAPVLEAQGYDYFWRASFGDDIPPFYCWFIKRDRQGSRTHHIHMIEADFEQWDNLLFRNYLIEHPVVAAEYARLKDELAAKYHNDRVVYTNSKTEFIREVTVRAKEYYGKSRE